MKKLLICNLFTFLFASTLCFSADIWDPQVSGTTQNLNSIFFLSTTSGFTVGNQGTLLSTSDGGNNWSPISLGSSSNFRKVYFKSNSIGYILSDDGKIFKSINGGSTWSSQTIHTSGLNGIDFNGNNGIAVGDNGHVFHTSNAGETWIPFGTISVFAFNDVKFLNDTTAVIVGVQGKVFKTNDRGITWSPLSSGTTSTLSSIALKDTTYYVVGTNGTILSVAPTLNKFTQEGTGLTANWLKTTVCTTDNYCYTAGTIASVLLNTGSSWEAKNLDENVNISSMYFANNNIGYTCGLGGVIYKTVSGGVNIKNTSLLQPRWKISPNPVNSAVNLNIDTSTEGTLTMHNALGNLVLTKKIENSTTSISLQHLSPGLYIAAFRSANGTSVKKVIKN